MSIRLLPIFNAIGCAVLMVLIVIQWKSGQSLEDQLRQSREQTASEMKGREDAEKRAGQLQSDVEGLKAAIEAIREGSERDRKAAEDAGKFAADKAGEVGALTIGLGKAQEQLKVWEEAVKSRDEKLKELNESLVATRQRLDEAIAKLKQAGAR
jgi:chromosome segregation ATPase